MSNEDIMQITEAVGNIFIGEERLRSLGEDEYADYLTEAYLILDRIIKNNQLTSKH